MLIFREMRSSRLMKFLMIHAVISIVVCAGMISRYAHVHEPIFEPYVIAFVQTFLGSFAGALLSLVQLTIGLFKSFAGAPNISLFSHAFPLPVVAGVSGLCAFVFMIAGIRRFSWKTMYLIFILSSLLFLYSTFTYLSDPANNTKPIMGQSMLMQPER